MMEHSWNDCFYSAQDNHLKKDDFFSSSCHQYESTVQRQDNYLWHSLNSFELLSTCQVCQSLKLSCHFPGFFIGFFLLLRGNVCTHTLCVIKWWNIPGIIVFLFCPGQPSEKKMTSFFLFLASVGINSDKITLFDTAFYLSCCQLVRFVSHWSCHFPGFFICSTDG